MSSCRKLSAPTLGGIAGRGRTCTCDEQRLPLIDRMRFHPLARLARSGPMHLRGYATGEVGARASTVS